MKTSITFFITILLGLQLTAQDYELGVNLGAVSYQGDLVEPNFDPGNAQFAYGIFIQKNFSHQLGLRLGFNGGTLAADDRDYDRFNENEENFKPIDFETNFGQLHLRLDYNLFGKYKKYFDRNGNQVPDSLVALGQTDLYDNEGQLVTENERKTRSWSPYIFAGPALTFLNADMREEDVSGLDSYPIMNEDEVPGSSFSLVFGGGVNFFLSEKMKLGIEVNAIAPFTDYLDGVSEVRNPEDDDFMAMFLFKFSYVFPNLKGNSEQ